MNINTKQGMQLVRVIKKMGIQDELTNTISEVFENQQKEENTYKKLSNLIVLEYPNFHELDDEERKKISKEFLSKNEELSKEIAKVQNSNAKLGINVIFKLVEAIPNAEKEVYKVLSEIYDKDIKEIETQSLEETIEQIKGILQCDSFKYFFSLATH